MKKRIIAMIMGISVAASLTACARSNASSTPAPAAASTEAESTDAAEGGSYTIRVACENSDTFPATLGLKQMEQYIESHTDGAVQVDIYSNGQLGGEDETLDQVAQGTLEMAIASFAPVVSYDSEFELLDIPFVFSDYDQAWMVLDSYVGTDLMDSLEGSGLKGLAFMENGFRQTTSSKGSIESVSDYKGLKIRTMQNNNHMKAFESLGANPTPVPFSELYLSLQQHVVDAQENPIANVTDKKLYEVQDYLSITNQIYDAMPLVCNLKFFNSLPEKYQKVVQAGAIYGMEYSRFLNAEREDEIIDYLETEQGMTVNYLSDEAKSEMKAAAQPAVIELVSSDIGKERVDQYLSDVDSILREISNY